MKLITRDTDFAIQALTYICEKGEEPISALTLSEKLKMPYPFLRGILQKLKGAGYLNSSKGKTGGFTLAKSAEQVTLLEILELFQGEVAVGQCFQKNHNCSRKRVCLFRTRLTGVQVELQRILLGVTVAALAKK